MHRIAPFALLAALLATAGSGLAVMEQIGYTEAFATATADGALAFAGENAAAAQGLAENQNASLLANEATGNLIAFRMGTEARILAYSSAMGADYVGTVQSVHGITGCAPALAGAQPLQFQACIVAWSNALVEI